MKPFLSNVEEIIGIKGNFTSFTKCVTSIIARGRAYSVVPKPIRQIYSSQCPTTIIQAALAVGLVENKGSAIGVTPTKAAALVTAVGLVKSCNPNRIPPLLPSRCPLVFQSAQISI